jgi:uncharacterized protein YyaL (SSP411 family)
MSESSVTPRATNRLIHETSPYLLQHAHNPVDWYPWCDEALERAKADDRLILLSIGYAACHWCHVMERESFEDRDTASFMNEQFVNIKVDREERPDLDDIYMAATVAMNQGQGGWPMTVFITPDLKPVYAGTYFPPVDGFGRPAFRTVLRAMAKAWSEDRAGLVEHADSVTDSIRRQRAQLDVASEIDDATLESALTQFTHSFDDRYGGFGGAPKFPPCTALSLLLRLHRRFGAAHALTMVCRTLDGMAQGGMYDHVGGGFSRYSTDREWLVPHFEKMLYDNALLSAVYLEGYQVTGDTYYKRVAHETLDFVLREMTSSEGGFFSSWDADSEGEEGKYYVWTPEQIAAVLDPQAARCFNSYYDITTTGNWEGRSIPNTPRAPEVVANELGLSIEELERTLEEARAKVHEARTKRIAPGLDDKVITAWNALMISALCAGYRTLNDARYLAAAKKATAFIFAELIDEDQRLLRTYRSGKAHVSAYLEDYAYLSNALVDLYEVSGVVEYLREAERLAQMIVTEFHDAESGAFFNTSRGHEELLLRYRDGADGATPAANAVAAAVLARLSYHLDQPEMRGTAATSMAAYGEVINRVPNAFARSLAVVDFLAEGPLEIAIVGVREAPDTEALRAEVGRQYMPNLVQAIADPADQDNGLPLVRGKQLLDGRAALYVCRNYSCQSPITDQDQVRELLSNTETGG